MDFPCSDCQYSETCFPVLKLAQKVKNVCVQGRRKKSQSKIMDFTGKPE